VTASIGRASRSPALLPPSRQAVVRGTGSVSLLVVNSHVITKEEVDCGLDCAPNAFIDLLLVPRPAIQSSNTATSAP
jgi:hypothetical protein